MLLGVALLAFAQDTYIQQIDALAKARDVEKLTAYLAPFKGRNPFNPLKTGGAYETGKYGWRALLLRMGARSFVVFTTPLTSEDIGELLFEIKDGKLTYVPEDVDNGEQIVSHAFNISFDLPAKRVKITDRIQLDQIAPASYPPMLRFGPNYRVSKITDAEGQPVAFLQAGGIVMFAGLRSRENLTLTYSAEVNRPFFAGSISDKEAILTNDYWYPMVARKPVPYTLSVTTPADWTAVGQGDRIRETSNGTQKLTQFKMEMPVSYYSFSASKYRTTTTEARGNRFSVWSNSMSAEDAKLQTEFYPAIIECFSQFAKYPFEGYGAVVTPAYGGGALEAYSFATYGSGMLPGEESHEPAHTWWGGFINNTYLHSLWNESFAVFCEGFYGRNASIGNTEERARAFIQTPDISPSFRVSPLNTASPFIGPAAESLGYGKGAYVLQMLEQEMGSATLVKCMREWIRTQSKTQGGEWEDFEAAVARVTQQDWRWFFNQWVEKPGWVDFDIRNVAWNNGRLSGQINFRSEPYILNCEVLLRTGEKVENRRVSLSTNNRDKTQTFAFKCVEKPDMISFDPWRRLLRPIQPDEAPVSLASELEQAKRFTDSAHRDYLPGVGAGASLSSLPSDLNDAFIVGHPSTVPQMAALCKKVGFSVSGDSLSYKGTTIDLNKGSALAVVELGNGKRCVIGLGKVRHFPNFGRAKVALTDDLGRFIRGETQPKTSGFLTFKL